MGSAEEAPILEEAIAHDHGLLDDDPARETREALGKVLRRERLFFGERPVCSVLSPRLLTTELYELLARTASGGG